MTGSRDDIDPIDRAIAAATAAQLTGQPLTEGNLFGLLDDIVIPIRLKALAVAVLRGSPDATLSFFLALKDSRVNQFSVWPEFLSWLIAHGVIMQHPNAAVRSYIQAAVIGAAVQRGNENAGQAGDTARRELAEKLVEIMRGQKDTLSG